MPDPIVGKTSDGQPIYKDDKGVTYILIDGKPKVDEKAIKSKAKEENMVEDFVTRDELRKRDMEGMRKDIEAKIKAREDVDLEIKGKVQELDNKVCKGEECYTRIEKNQQDMYKMLEERLKRLDEPRFVCRKCHSASIRKGDKACSICGDAVDVVWN